MRNNTSDKKKEFLEKLGGEKVMRRELRRLRERERILVDALCEIKASYEGKSSQGISTIIDGCMAELSNVTKDDKFERTTKFAYLEADLKRRQDAAAAAQKVKMMNKAMELVERMEKGDDGK